MREKITLNEILEIIFANFISMLGIKNDSDVLKLEEYLKNLLSSMNNDWSLMEKKLIEMFSSIKIYSDKDEKKYKKKLSKVNFNYLIFSF